ncbi:MAG: NUDIX domain-containing protein [Balneolaceae bacterium]|nr:NUDIX domain-containing protein [Balneolaceae bacterium]
MSGQAYQNTIRIRVNGLLVREESLLLVKMLSPVTNQHIWTPPGGGLEFEESMEKCLIREFEEETGLRIAVEHLRYINELISTPYHALQFFFEVKEKGGTLQLGSDPEADAGDQILEDLRFIPFDLLGDYPIVPDYVADRFPRDFRSGRETIRFN